MQHNIKPTLVYRKDTGGYKGILQIEKYPQLFPHTPAKHVKHYGTSGFEGILAVPGVDKELYILTLDQHIDRMLRTMDSLLMTKPKHLDDNVAKFNKIYLHKNPSKPIKPNDQKYLKIKKEEVKDAIMETIKRNVQEGNLDPKKLIYIRPNVYRDEKVTDKREIIPALGVAALAHDVVFEVMTLNVPRYLDSAPPDGARVLVFEKALFAKEGDPYYEIILDGLCSPLRKIKSGANYGLGGMAKNLANYYGCDEALITNHQMNVLEGGGENAFAVIDNTLWTPPLKQSILPGTKRALVLEIAKRMRIPVKQKNIPLEVFIDADAAAFSGTWCGFEPIAHLYWYSQDIESNYDENNEIIKSIKEQYNYLITGDRKLDSNLKDLETIVRTHVDLS